MNVVDKEVNIKATLEVSTTGRPKQVHVEITAEVIRLNYRWNQCEISVSEAKSHPNRIATIVFGCVPEIYVFEAENIVKFIKANLN